MASHHGSRKRARISHTEAKAISTQVANETLPSTATESATCSAPAATQMASKPCHHEQALKTLQTDIEAMRELVTCKICHRFLFEPYSLSCGHTYCYSCISQWLVNRSNKTCPDCRIVVSQQPTPSYVIRELVLIFIARNELLPDGETSEEHNNIAKEEAMIVANDKANTDSKEGGLFKGRFTRGQTRRFEPIYDPSDGVDRCARCHWEIVEDDFCPNCGTWVRDEDGVAFSDIDVGSDMSEEDMDHELDIEDAEAVFGPDGQDDYLDIAPDGVFGPRGMSRGATGRQVGGWRHRRPTPHISVESSAEEESEDDEHDPELDGFIDDGDLESEESDGEDGTDNTEVQEIANPPRRRARARVLLSDDEQEEIATSTATEVDAHRDSEDEEQAPFIISRRADRSAPGRRPPPQIISSDEGGSESENDGDEWDVSGIASTSSPQAGSVSGVEEESNACEGYDSESVSSLQAEVDNDNADGGDEDSDDESTYAGWGSNRPRCR